MIKRLAVVSWRMGWEYDYGNGGNFRARLAGQAWGGLMDLVR